MGVLCREAKETKLESEKESDMQLEDSLDSSTPARSLQAAPEGRNWTAAGRALGARQAGNSSAGPQHKMPVMLHARMLVVKESGQASQRVRAPLPPYMLAVWKGLGWPLPADARGGHS